MAVFRINQDARAVSATGALGGRLVAAVRSRLRARAPAGLPKAVEFLSLAAVGVLSAKFFWLLFAPMPDPPATIVSAPAPAAAGEVKSPFGDTELASAAEPVEQTEFAQTSLNLALHGTWIDASGGAAIIKTSSGEQKRFSAGEEIEPGVVLSKVLRDQVVLSRAGISESLRLENRNSEPLVQQGAESAAVDAVAAQGLGAIGSVIQVTPRTDSVGAVRLTLAPRGSPAAFAKLGLEPGDILVSIDGRPLSSDIASEVERMRSLASRERVEIAIERNGAVMPITVPISTPIEE